MTKGLGADVTSGEAKLLEGDGTSLPEMYNKKESTTGQATMEPIKVNLLDTLLHVNGNTKETDHISDAKCPKDAVEEWPAPKKTHNFYFVRVRPQEDPMLKPKLEAADRDIYMKNQVRFQIIKALRDKKSERANVIFQLKPLGAKEKQLSITIDEKRREMESTQASLEKLKFAHNTARENGRCLCSLEEDLDDHLISCNMNGVRKEQHAVRAKIKHFEEELKSIDNEIDSMQEELDVVSSKRTEAHKAANNLRKARDEASSSYNEYRSILNTAHQFSARNCVAALEMLSCSEVEKFMSQYSSRKDFRDNYKRRILSSLESRQLCMDGTTRNPDGRIAIEQQQRNQQEKNPAQNTMTQTIEQHAHNRQERTPAQITVAGELALLWEDSILTSNVQDEVPKDEVLKPTKVEPTRQENNDVANEIGDSKELSKPNEIDVVANGIGEFKELPKPNEIDVNGIGESKELSKLNEIDIVAELKEWKRHEEVTKALANEIGESKELPRPNDNEIDAAAELKERKRQALANEIGESKELPKPNEIDAAAELKERKRQEEITKAKLALDRKRKLAEKAAAKAAAWAQKEAEKAAAREKEKQARKKGEIVETSAPPEQTETDTKTVEVEEAEAKPEAPILGHGKEKMEKVRFRGRIKSPAPVPKAIIKRKRYPYGAFAGAALLILAFCFLVYVAISDKIMRQAKNK